jgi:hypothetical protein
MWERVDDEGRRGWRMRGRGKEGLREGEGGSAHGRPRKGEGGRGKERVPGSGREREGTREREGGSAPGRGCAQERMHVGEGARMWEREGKGEGRGREGGCAGEGVQGEGGGSEGVLVGEGPQGWEREEEDARTRGRGCARKGGGDRA